MYIKGLDTFGKEFIYHPSLVLYLPLDKLDGSSFMSRDHYGHLCTVTGATWTPQGRKFDGVDDSINCGTSSVLDLGVGNFTFLFWLKPDLSVDNRKPFCKGLWHTDGIQSWVYSDGSLGFELCRAGAGSVLETGAGALVTNEWHHIAMTKSGANGSILVNSVEKATSSSLVDAKASTRPFYIGRYDTAYMFLKGTMDEFLAHNRALSPLEIQHIYNVTKWRYR